MFVPMARRVYRATPNLQYRQRIMLVILLFTLLPVIAAAAVALPLYKHYAYDRFVRVQTEQARKSVDGVERIYQSSIQKLVFLNNNPVLMRMLNEDYRADLAGYLDIANQVNSLMRALESDHTNGAVRVYGLKDSLYSSEYVKRADLLDRRILNDAIGLADNRILSRVTADPLNGDPDLSLFGTIADLGQTVAITEMKVPFDTLYRLFDYDIAYDGFILYASKDKLYPLNAGTAVPAMPPNPARYRIVTFAFNGSEDRFMLYLDRGVMFRQFLKQLIMPVLLLVAFVCAIYFSVKAVSFILTKRLSDLMKRMSMDIRLSKDEAIGNLRIEDEFGLIDRRFQYLVQEIREHYNEMSESRIQQQTLEAELLQVHLNPHFLYNTLSAIKWSFPDERLASVVDSLVSYYRIFLNKGQSRLSLQRELEMVRNYLDIQKFAYQSDFAYDIEAAPDVLQQPVIKNMVQPIVENAILHGINGLEGGGRIRIRAFRAQEGCRIVIEDNGVGMSEEQLRRLTDMAPAHGEGEAAAMPGGYGIYNIRQRLALYYGAGASVDVRSEPGAGTTVTLTIPEAP